MNSDNDPVLYNAIGETSDKIYGASEALIGVVEKIRKADSIAAFMVPGPKWSKFPWMVMIGPCPAMCTEATEMAVTCFKDTTKHIAEDPFAEEDNDDRQ